MMNSKTREQFYEIELANSQDVSLVDENFLGEVARQTLSAERVSAATISIALVDNPTIRELNKQYLDHDFATDVLSFSLAGDLQAVLPAKSPDARRPDQRHAASSGSPRGMGKTIDGEIILSVEMAAQSAERYDWSPAAELALYLVHGLLHLCGYEDSTDSECNQMRTREREILEKWSLKPNYQALEQDEHCSPSLGERQERSVG